MFDIHSHIIYGVDDGARDLKEALKITQMDAAQGALDIIATPHFSVSHPTDPAVIEDRLEELEDVLWDVMGDKAPCLYTGSEVLWFDSMPEYLNEGWILPLAGSSYTLVEFYPDESYRVIVQAVRSLRQAGWRPIIAHAERFHAVVENGLDELISQGAYIQCSTEPFRHRFLAAANDPELRFIIRAIKKGQVHFLGSDMHRTDRRPPEISDCISWIEKHLSGEEAERLLYRNARCIPEDREI